MKQENRKPIIFLSYSWNNDYIANEIDSFFKSIGLILKRDTRDAKYKDSITQYMKDIGDADYVLMILSNEFLKSPNCLFEAMELMIADGINEKLLPIILDKTAIFKPEDRIDWIEYWEKKYKELNIDCKKVEQLSIDETITEKLRQYDFIKKNISKFLGIVSDLNAKTYEYHKGNNFKDI
ncbi:toll/interleukin-1 receptor domain-containing protein, partial [Bacteroidota bacterium]